MMQFEDESDKLCANTTLHYTVPVHLHAFMYGVRHNASRNDNSSAPVMLHAILYWWVQTSFNKAAVMQHMEHN